MKKLAFISLMLLTMQSQAGVLNYVKNALTFEPKPAHISNKLISAVLESNADRVYDIVVTNDIKDKHLLEKCLNLVDIAFKNGGHKRKGFIQIMYGALVGNIAPHITIGILHLLKIAPVLEKLLQTGIGFEHWAKEIGRQVTGQTAAAAHQEESALKMLINHIYRIYSWYLIWNGIKIFRKQGKIDEMLAIKSFLHMKLDSLSQVKA